LPEVERLLPLKTALGIHFEHGSMPFGLSRLLIWTKNANSAKILPLKRPHEASSMLSDKQMREAVREGVRLAHEQIQQALQEKIQRVRSKEISA
jgi:hypothetical protein